MNIFGWMGMDFSLLSDTWYFKDVKIIFVFLKERKRDCVRERETVWENLDKFVLYYWYRIYKNIYIFIRIVTIYKNIIYNIYVKNINYFY